jgi:hypothetical protein
MKRAAILFVAACSLARTLPASTAHDLRHRFAVDGSVSDFAADEWVVDGSTPVRELPGDSRWGADNDIARIAVSWDDYHLYAAVEASTNRGTLMLFIDTMCGGAPGLASIERFRRNVEFGGLTPNFLLQASRGSPVAEAAYLDCTRPMNLIEEGAFSAVYLQDGPGGGALEVAIPWEALGDFERGADGLALPRTGAELSMLAIVTGGVGTGAGDAAPDPSVPLDDDSTRTAVCDNHVILPLDGDGDGVLDAGAAPRSAARYAAASADEGTSVNQIFALRIPLGQKLFALNANEPAVFPVALDERDSAGAVFLTVTIYSSDGRVVRELREDDPAEFASGIENIEWDYRDDHGGFVPGGIYIIAAAAGPGLGAPKSTVKAAFAVAR